MQQDLSISFLVYDNSKILYDNLWNLVAAVPTDFSCRLYIIDNYSGDGSWQEMQRFERDFKVKSEAYSHVSLELVANPENVGFGRGHNTLLGRLESRYHLVLNPDIRIGGPEQMAAMIEYLEEHPDVGLLVPQLKNTDGSIQYLCKKNPTLLDLMIRRLPFSFLRSRQDVYTMMESGYDRVMDVEYVSGCFMLFRTEVFQSLAGFDERFFMYLEDADISRRVNQVSRTIFYPHAQVFHDWYRGTYKHPKLFLINVHSIMLYFSKWGWKLW